MCTSFAPSLHQFCTILHHFALYCALVLHHLCTIFAQSLHNLCAIVALSLLHNYSVLAQSCTVLLSYYAVYASIRTSDLVTNKRGMLTGNTRSERKCYRNPVGEYAFSFLNSSNRPPPPLPPSPFFFSLLHSIYGLTSGTGVAEYGP